MSQKYTGGFITKSPVAPTSSAASGIWTLDQQQQAKQAGNWPSPPIFIEDVFSCFLYTGNGTSQTITNGIDLSGQGGLVWTKDRNSGANHQLFDTSRGLYKRLATNSTAAEFNYSPDGLTAFNANGFTMTGNGDYNSSGYLIASWTFREQPKFFDIVTYTGTGVARTVAHNLGSVPGCIIVKKTSGLSFWSVYHRSTGATQVGFLDATSAFSASSPYWNDTEPTSSVFTVGIAGAVNDSGQTYVAYLFAHDAGGFPVSGGGSTNGISCGSYTGNGSTTGPTVTLGYEPQWLMIKKSSAISGSESWAIWDNMRNSGLWDDWLIANDAQAEQVNNANVAVQITSTGFFPNATNNTSNSYVNTSGSTYIYIAIRRGPMKTPTVGTSVYNAIARTGTGATANVTGVGFPVDLNWSHIRDAAYPNVMDDRLRGATNTLKPSTSDGEAVSSTVTSFASMDGVQYGTSDRTNASGNTYVNWYFKRAPGFFDEVCYTGDNINGRNITHNLGVVPELIIVKNRVASYGWTVYNAVDGYTYNLYLETTAAKTTANQAWYAAPTTTTFSVTNGTDVNSSSSNTYVAYLFATLAGVSKVGSYTGTGALLTVACGFTSGARFVLIKRTDSTGGWYMYDSVRGITSGNDPYLFANVDAVEVTGTNYVDTDTTGFKVTAAAPAGLNASGGTYIFLAIA